MSLVSENIKYLRRQKGLTQGQFAEEIGIKRSLVGAYEEGRADPRLSNLTKMADLFGVSVDRLITQDVRELSAKDLKVEGFRQKLKVLAITTDKEEKENIHLVPQKAAAGYLNGYADLEYVEELPKFQLPILPSNASYRAFEISGDSMLPIQPGTIVIGEYVDQIEDVKSGKTYVVITEQEGIVFKRVFNYLEERGKLFMVSDNQTYSPYDVEPSEIIEVWAAKAYISVDFPDPQFDKKDMSVDKLASIVIDLQKEIMQLKKS